MEINGKICDALKIENPEELSEIMKSHAEQAGCIYETAIRMNMTNEQSFINWQDNINMCSYIQEEDLKRVTNK